MIYNAIPTIGEIMADIESTQGSFDKGYEDCKNGVPHELGQGKEYDDGYSDRYHWEAMQNG